MERIEEWVAKMGGGERSRKFLSFGEQDVVISCSGDGKIGTYAADTGVTGGRLGSQKAAVFTGSQMQEFEKQNLICKYMMASIPVPPQLLVPFPRTQSNKHGSDPELWRCRRTDGKKWRCSKDVLPDQKYCERHAHKNRHRSRKHVEILSQKNYPVPNFQFSAAASCDQARGGSIGQNKQKQQLILSPPSTLGFTIGNAKNINTSLYRLEVNNGEKGFLSSNPYVHRNFGFPQGSWNANAQNFFGAQSAREEDGLHNAHGCFSCKSCLFPNQKVPFSSLSMSIGSGSGEDSQNHGFNKNNPESWSSSSMPGGPLGEALCLGTASNLPSPHGHSNSSGTSSGSFL